MLKLRAVSNSLLETTLRDSFLVSASGDYIVKLRLKKVVLLLHFSPEVFRHVPETIGAQVREVKVTGWSGYRPGPCVRDWRVVKGPSISQSEHCY